MIMLNGQKKNCNKNVLLQFFFCVGLWIKSELSFILSSGICHYS